MCFLGGEGGDPRRRVSGGPTCCCADARFCVIDHTIKATYCRVPIFDRDCASRGSPAVAASALDRSARLMRGCPGTSGSYPVRLVTGGFHVRETAGAKAWIVSRVDPTRVHRWQRLVRRPGHRYVDRRNAGLRHERTADGLPGAEHLALVSPRSAEPWGRRDPAPCVSLRGESHPSPPRGEVASGGGVCVTSRRSRSCRGRKAARSLHDAVVHRVGAFGAAVRPG